MSLFSHIGPTGSLETVLQKILYLLYGSPWLECTQGNISILKLFEPNDNSYTVFGKKHIKIFFIEIINVIFLECHTKTVQLNK